MFKNTIFNVYTPQLYNTHTTLAQILSILMHFSCQVRAFFPFFLCNFWGGVTVGKQGQAGL